MAALQKFEVSLSVDGWAVRQLRRLDWGYLDRDLPRDGLGELALHAEYVLEITVITLGPDCLVGARGNEAHAQAHAVADQEYGAFENSIDVELARDLGQRLLDALVRHHRSPRDHAQRFEPGEVGNERSGHPIGEVLLRRVLRYVSQRHHGDCANDVAARDRQRGSRHAFSNATQRFGDVRGGGRTIRRVLAQTLGDKAIQRGRRVGTQRAHRLRGGADDREHQRFVAVLHER